MEKKKKGVRIIIISIVLICLVLGYFYYLSNRKTDRNPKDDVKLTEVQKVLLRNLDNNYPPTPREVVKYFGELAQCLYGSDYTEEEFSKLAEQARRLYDDELLAINTPDEYMDKLRADVGYFKEQKMVISSYSPASSTDVEQFVQDGYSWAQMRCTFTMRQGTQIDASEGDFLLRKDENGHWKIYGWILADDGNGPNSNEQ